jgi:hypothetical protein
VRPATLNIARSIGVFLIVCAAASWTAPALRAARGWEQVGSPTVAAMLVFCTYTAAYLAIGIAYIARKRAYDRHVFPEGLRLEGADAVRLGVKYLILASIAAFGATLIYAVILRGMRYTPLLGG